MKPNIKESHKKYLNNSPKRITSEDIRKHERR